MDENCDNRLTRINPVQIIQIRSESQSFNGSFDVLLDVGGRVGDGTITVENIEPTFRGDC